MVYHSVFQHCRQCHRYMYLHEEVSLQKRTYPRCLRPYRQRSRTKRDLMFEWGLIPAELENKIMPEVFYDDYNLPAVQVILTFMRVCKSWYKHAREYICHDE